MKKNYTLLNYTLFGALFVCATLLSVYSATAQTLNFTIDTAVDNGNNITETINNGGDVYVLTIDHVQDVEQLFDLGGGDFTFFLGSANGPTPFVLTITENGTPANLKLNGMDYDTVVAGTISVLNQDDASISNPTVYPIGFGAINIDNPTNATGISEIRILPGNGLDLNNFVFHNINVDILPTLSIDNNASLANSISVFPNPSNGDITIKSSSIAMENLIVRDLNGRTIYTNNLNRVIGSQDLKMNSILSTGMYLITISSAKHSITKKLIIE